VYLQSQSDAFRLVGDLASVFRGVSYWMGGSITTVADMPQDPVYTFNASNVIGGKFTYQSSARKTRYTTALVTYNDPANSYKQAVEYVQDTAGVARYGLQPTSFVAFGATSQGQAHRAGLWAITSSQVETDSVSFAVGLEGLKAAPGQIITVQDPARAGARQGGRISSATASAVTVDRAPDVVKVGDTLTVLDSSGVSQTRTIAVIDGRTLTVGQAFTDAPVAQSVWHVESPELATQTFKVLNVKEDVGNGKIQFTINALQHNASKFAHIDSGAQLQIPPISRLPVGSQKPATNVRITSHQVVEQGIANNVMTIAWDAPADGAANYKVEWQKDNGQWIQAGTVSSTSTDIVGVYTGTYVARITALNNAGSPSVVALSPATAVTGKTGEPPKLTTLTATSLPFGISLDWTFPPNTSDTQRTELWASTNAVRPDADGTIAYEMGGYAYPTSHTELHGLSAGASLFFWGRIVDKAGNIGGWYPETGAVNGQSISDPSLLQDYWAGTIGRSALMADLLEDIDSAAGVAGQVQQQAQDILKNAQDIAAEELARANADNSLGSHITNVESTANDASTKVGQLTTRTTAAESKITTLQQTTGQQATQLTQLNTTVGQHTTTISALSQTQQDQANQLNELEVTSGLPVKAGADTTKAGANTRKAGIYTYSVARVDGDLAEAVKTETLAATVGVNTATIQNVSQAQVSGDMALASRIDTVAASLAGNTAAVQAVADAQVSLNGRVSSSYVVKTQISAGGVPYAAGFAVGVDYSGGTVSSQFLVNASTFAIIDASAAATVSVYPFVVQGGQTFINQALIGTGWITNAMIGNKIASTTTRPSDGLPRWEWNKDGGNVTRGDEFTMSQHPDYGIHMTAVATGVLFIEFGKLP